MILITFYVRSKQSIEKKKDSTKRKRAPWNRLKLRSSRNQAQFSAHLPTEFDVNLLAIVLTFALLQNHIPNNTSDEEIVSHCFGLASGFGIDLTDIFQMHVIVDMYLMYAQFEC